MLVRSLGGRDEGSGTAPRAHALQTKKARKVQSHRHRTYAFSEDKIVSSELLISLLNTSIRRHISTISSSPGISVLAVNSLESPRTGPTLTFGQLMIWLWVSSTVSHNLQKRSEFEDFLLSLQSIECDLSLKIMQACL